LRARSRALLYAAGTVALTVAGCGSSSSPGGGAAAGAQSAQRVEIRNYAFVAPSVVVTRGGSVSFTNHDGTAHTATAVAQGVFDTGAVAPGATRTVRLTKAGTFTYFCAFHAFMRGTIVVR
jgi:plastocyanin